MQQVNMNNTYETIPQQVKAQQMTFSGFAGDNSKIPFNVGDWVVMSSSGIRVISDEDFHKQYRKVQTVQPRQPLYPNNLPPFPPKRPRDDKPFVTFVATGQ